MTYHYIDSTFFSPKNVHDFPLTTSFTLALTKHLIW